MSLEQATEPLLKKPRGRPFVKGRLAPHDAMHYNNDRKRL